MLTGIDHVMICVPDLARAMDTFTRLGFAVHRGGVHDRRGTENAIAFTGEQYLELLAIRDRDQYQRATGSRGGLTEFLARGPGFRYIAVQSDDLEADVAAMRQRGVHVSDVTDGARRTPAGVELRWKSATLGGDHALPIFFVQHLTPLEERRAHAPGPNPNGVERIDRAYVAVHDVDTAASHYARALGLPKPTLERGRVVKADMAVFEIGGTGLTIAQPAEPGAASDALARRGAGPFQVLYRTRRMDVALRWMSEHAVPAPRRAIRNTGEPAMFVGPDFACGTYVAFVGSA
jgi:catechol 2,3-dioxygenase-like lactoylglutathione lyase family enzyme